MASSLCRSKSHCPTTCERTRTYVYIYIILLLIYADISHPPWPADKSTPWYIRRLFCVLSFYPIGNITKSTRRPCRHQAWSQCCHRRGVKSSGGEKEWDLELFGWGMEVHMISLSIIFLELLWLCKCLIALSFQCIIVYYLSFFDHKITYTTCILCIHTQSISQFEIMFLIWSFQVSIFFFSIGDVTMAGHCLWNMCHQVIAPTNISSERCSLRHTSCVFHQNQMYLIHKQY